jgi:general secretion pathway protein G
MVKSRRAFTLIELLVVMAVIATLLTIAIPRYFSSIERSKEAVLRENLNVVRDAIDKFHADNDSYPASLEQLVTSRYLRSVPVDPVTESATTWVVQRPPGNLVGGGVYDIRSGAEGKSSGGVAYSDL